MEQQAVLFIENLGHSPAFLFAILLARFGSHHSPQTFENISHETNRLSVYNADQHRLVAVGDAIQIADMSRQRLYIYKLAKRKVGEAKAALRIQTVWHIV